MQHTRNILPMSSAANRCCASASGVDFAKNAEKRSAKHGILYRMTAWSIRRNIARASRLGYHKMTVNRDDLLDRVALFIYPVGVPLFIMSGFFIHNFSSLVEAAQRQDVLSVIGSALCGAVYMMLFSTMTLSLPFARDMSHKESYSINIPEFAYSCANEVALEYEKRGFYFKVVWDYHNMHSFELGWVDDDFASDIGKLSSQPMFDAYDAGVPIEDILA